MDQPVSRLEREREIQETPLRSAPYPDAGSDAPIGPTRARPKRLYGVILAALLVLATGAG